MKKNTQNDYLRALLNIASLSREVENVGKSFLHNMAPGSFQDASIEQNLQEHYVGIADEFG